MEVRVVRRRFRSIVLIPLVIAACAAPPMTPAPPSRVPGADLPGPPPVSPPSVIGTSPPPAGSPEAASSQPTGAPAPPPTMPAHLPLVAVAERDGIRVKVELERNPLPTGEITRVRTTVRNLLDVPLLWASDGCATAVGVHGVADEGWRPGVVQTGVAHTFKVAALDAIYTKDAMRPWLTFVRPEDVGGPVVGCADVGLGHRIAPGEAIHATRAWDGLAEGRLGPFPTGPVTLHATFGDYRRPGEPVPEWPDIPVIDVTLEAWVTDGADASWLSPPEVVDVALADAAFAEFLRTHEVVFNAEEILVYRPGRGVWEVGIARRLGHGRGWRATYLVVDPRSGAILDRVERPWDLRTELS